MERMNLFKLADVYEDSEVFDSIMDGKRIVFRNEKGDYLEVILFERSKEWRYILDNFPSQRKIFNSILRIIWITECTLFYIMIIYKVLQLY